MTDTNIRTRVPLGEAFLAAILLLTSVAHAATLTVGAGAQFDTIGGALKKAKDGDEIAVQPGKYEESINLKKAVTLRGAGPGQCTVHARKSVLGVSKLSAGGISGFTFEVDSLAEDDGAELKGCGSGFTLEGNEFRCADEGGEGEKHALIVVSGGSPSFKANTIAGGVEIKDGAEVDMRSERFPGRPGTASAEVPILVRSQVEGTAKFQGNGIANIDLTKPVQNGLTRNLRTVLPQAIELVKGNVQLAEDHWEVTPRIKDVAGKIEPARASVVASITVVLEVRRQNGTSVATAEGTAVQEDASPPFEQYNGQVIANYGSLAAGIKRGFGTDPFAGATKGAIAQALKTLNGELATAVVARQETRALDVAVKKASSGDRAALEDLARHAKTPAAKRDALDKLLDLDIDDAIASKDLATLKKLASDYPHHPRKAEMERVIADARAKAAKMEEEKRQKKQEMERAEADKAYAPARDANTVEAYEQFIAANPTNPNVEDARARIEGLREYFKVGASASPDHLVDVKKDPKVFGDALTRVPEGTLLPVKSSDGKWVCVVVNGKTGYLPAAAGKLGKKSEL